MANLLETCNQAADESVFEAVLQNTELLHKVLEQLQSYARSSEPAQLAEEYLADKEFQCDAVTDANLVEASLDAIAAVDQNIQLLAENESLRNQLADLQEAFDRLQSDRDELAACTSVLTEQLTNSSTKLAPTVPTSSELPTRQPARDESAMAEMSWDERKQQILEELENDSFDAEAFLSTLQVNPSSDFDAGTGCQSDPRDQIAAFIESLQQEIERLSDLTKQHEVELAELRTKLDEADQRLVSQQTANDSLVESEEPSTDYTEAITELLDKDTIIRQEREKLEQLQTDFQTLLRDAEIETSLERAKLSRERLELEQKNETLQQQLDNIERQSNGSAGVSTKWMAKLGLTRQDDTE